MIKQTKLIITRPIAITVVLLMVLAPMIAQAGNNPGILPANSKPYGMTYGEWSGEFWKWLYSMPVDQHPLFDSADCSEGQSGDVWFLGGTFAVTEPSPGEILGKVTRDCTVPAGKALFFPIANVECSTVEDNGETETELRTCANQFADLIVTESLKATVDGVSILNLKHYRVESPLFTFGPLPENNVLQSSYPNAVPGATSPSVSDGVHLMLAPLSPGKHILHWEGSIDLRSIDGLPLFIQDITYNIKVKKEE